MTNIEQKALELVNSTFLEPYYKDWAEVPQGCLSNALIRAIEERETLSAENERLRELLARNINDEPCWRDHHGYCQAHYLETDCSVSAARAALGETK